MVLNFSHKYIKKGWVMAHVVENTLQSARTWVWVPDSYLQDKIFANGEAMLLFLSLPLPLISGCLYPLSVINIYFLYIKILARSNTTENLLKLWNVKNNFSNKNLEYKA